jgi:hypothetical protein
MGCESEELPLQLHAVSVFIKARGRGHLEYMYDGENKKFRFLVRRLGRRLISQLYNSSEMFPIHMCTTQ